MPKHGIGRVERESPYTIRLSQTANTIGDANHSTRRQDSLIQRESQCHAISWSFRVRQSSSFHPFGPESPASPLPTSTVPELAVPRGRLINRNNGRKLPWRQAIASGGDTGRFECFNGRSKGDRQLGLSLRAGSSFRPLFCLCASWAHGFCLFTNACVWTWEGAHSQRVLFALASGLSLPPSAVHLEGDVMRQAHVARLHRARAASTLFVFLVRYLDVSVVALSFSCAFLYLLRRKV